MIVVDGLETVEGLLNQSNLHRQTAPSTSISQTHAHDKTKDSHSHPHHHHHQHIHDTHTKLTNLTHKGPSIPTEPDLHDPDDDTVIDDDDNDQVDPNDYDQYLPHPPPPRPPSSPGGNRHPSIIGLDKLNPADLQEILHHLAHLGGDTSQEQHHQVPHGPPPRQQQPSFVPGAYTTVQTAQQVAELENAGGRFIGRAEDGSFIVAVPQPQPHILHNPNSNAYPHVGRGPGAQRPAGPPPSHQHPQYSLPPNAPPSAHVGFPGWSPNSPCRIETLHFVAFLFFKGTGRGHSEENNS